jgi:hypothetical protein
MHRVIPWIGIVAAALVSACGGPSSPASASLSEGRWNGTTAHGAPITLTVNADETLTEFAVGYSFNGCSGTQAFSNLNISTKPDVTCVPGPCSGTVSSYRQFAYSSGRAPTEPNIFVVGLFLPGDRAQGQVSFQNYPGCGTATGVEWTATRR